MARKEEQMGLEYRETLGDLISREGDMTILMISFMLRQNSQREGDSHS